MTSLAGEFQTDLARDDALAACAEAIHSLGWHIESVAPSLLVSYTGPPGAHPPKVEIALADAHEGTAIRIVGSDSEAKRLDEDVLVTELTRVRDAIGDSVSDQDRRSTEGGAPEGEAEAETPPSRNHADTTLGVQAPPGWYDDPEGSGKRWWDGEQWAEPSPQVPIVASGGSGETSKSSEAAHLLWGLSLAFGTVGGSAALFGLPVISFYFPLCFGISGAVLALVAWTAPGTSPRWAILAVIASVGGIAIGVDGYSQYQDAQDQLDQAQEQLDQFGSP